MKKAALSIITACVFFVAMAVAQSSTGQDQGSTASQGTTSSSPTTSSPSSTSPQDQTAPSGSSSSTGSQTGSSPDQGSSSSGSSMGQGSTSGSSSGSSMGQGSSSGSMSGGEMKGEKGAKGEKTLKGCVKSEGGQTVLEEKKGKEVALTGADVSAHVGHEVKVHGTWEKGGSSSAASSGSASGSASSGKTFNVTSVEMVSDTCSMGKSSKGDHMKGGSSGTSGSSSQSSPPQR